MFFFFLMAISVFFCGIWENMLLLWYSAAVSHVLWQPWPWFGEGAEGPPPSTGEGVSLTPPYALKLMIDFDSLIMVKLYCLVPPPFPGMGDHYCPIWLLYMYLYCFCFRIIYSNLCIYCLLYITLVNLRPWIKEHLNRLCLLFSDC